MRICGLAYVVASIITMLLIWSITFDWSLDGEKFQKVLDVFDPHSQQCPVHNCPTDSFAFHVRSGAANIIGPKICFSGSIIMGGVKNNVGAGLNVVLVDGETGTIVKSNYFNMHSKDADIFLEFLKTIKPGSIVLMASFVEPAMKLTDEIRDILYGLGSNVIKSLKKRDSWVFAVRAGGEADSRFEKHMPNDEKTNIYEGWPELVELGGCFPRGR